MSHSPDMIFTWLKASSLAIALLGQSIQIPWPAGFETSSPIGLKTMTAVSHVEHDQVKVSLHPRIEVSGGGEAELSRLGEALDRFSSRGMRLPDLEVRFANDDAECNGHLGLFQKSHSPWRLLVCSDLEFVLTHELAHAWDAANLSPSDRDHYLAFRGLESWSSPEHSWKDRGEEDAAFVMTKVLMAGEKLPDSQARTELLSAFDLLTNSSGPNSLPSAMNRTYVRRHHRNG